MIRLILLSGVLFGFFLQSMCSDDANNAANNTITNRANLAANGNSVANGSTANSTNEGVRSNGSSGAANPGGGAPADPNSPNMPPGNR